MTEFIRGIRTSVRTTLDAGVGEDGVEQRRVLAVPVARMRKRARQPASCRSMARFRTAWVTQAAVGCGVAPRMRIRTPKIHQRPLDSRKAVS
jgi:hypothetical protein